MTFLSRSLDNYYTSIKIRLLSSCLQFNDKNAVPNQLFYAPTRLIPKKNRKMKVIKCDMVLSNKKSFMQYFINRAE